MSSRSAKGGRKRAVTRGTANVFADLGFPDAVERQAKLRLAYALNQLLVRRRLSPAATSRLVRVTRAQVSAIRRYKLAGISVERLMTLLTALGQDVHVVITSRPRSRQSAHIAVVTAWK